MNRRLSSNGYLYAIQSLVAHWRDEGIRGLGSDYDKQMEAIAAAAGDVDDTAWRDDATSLLVAAEVLAMNADARSAKARWNDGELYCALFFDDAHELLDNAPNEDEVDDFDPDGEDGDDADSDDSDDE